MIIQETKTRTITLTAGDIKQAIIMYVKARGEREIDNENIELDPNSVSAVITIVEKTEPKQL